MSDETVRLRDSLKKEQKKRFGLEDELKAYRQQAKDSVSKDEFQSMQLSLGNELKIAREQINCMVKRSDFESIQDALERERQKSRRLYKELREGRSENEKKMKKTVTKLKDEVRALRRRNVHQ